MSLSCPKCKHALQSIHVEGMEFEICGGCNGCWYDKDELLYYLRPRLGQPDLQLIEKESRPAHHLCPRCLVPLREMKFSAGGKLGSRVVSDLLVDHCATCKGIWLDAGEIHAIEEISRGIPEAEEQLHAAVRSIREENMRLCRELNGRRMSKSHLTPILAGAFVLCAIMVYSSIPSRKYADPPHSTTSLGSKKCATCNGTGHKVHLCEDCKGTGKRSGASRVTCPSCNGLGRFTSGAHACGRCGGSGWVHESGKTCSKCEGSGRLAKIDKQTCRTCSGSGQMLVRENCIVCGGSGRSSVNPQWTCPSCNGRGSVENKKTCSSCMGGLVETRRDQTCPECRGSGRGAEGKKICDECLGSGKSDALNESVCARCNGLGSVVSADPHAADCPTCRGSGNLGSALCNDCKGRGVI